MTRHLPFFPFVLGVALLCACGGPEPQPAARDPQPVQPAPARPQPAPSPRTRPADPASGPAAGPTADPAADPTADPQTPPALLPPIEPLREDDARGRGMAEPSIFSGGIVDDDPATWQDATSGPAATLIYVTRKREQKDEAPMALVFSSDPAHRQFQRRDSARVSIMRLKKEGMGALLAELERDGLSRLPWASEPYDQTVGPERALLLYRDGKRVRVAKAGLSEAQLADFSAIERRLIRLTTTR